jgi:hypothetical protein
MRYIEMVSWADQRKLLKRIRFSSEKNSQLDLQKNLDLSPDHELSVFGPIPAAIPGHQKCHGSRGSPDYRVMLRGYLHRGIL